MAGHHDAHVDHVEIVALQDHGDDVLADVMHIALDGGDDDLALALDVATSRLVQALFFFDVGDQVRHGGLHDPCALDHLGQEHLALAEQVADDVHAVHQRAFDDVQRAPALGQDLTVGFFGVLGDEVGDTVHHGMGEALCHRCRRLRRAAPLQLLALVLGSALSGLGNLDQAFARVGATVQNDIFHPFAQHRLDIVVNANHAGVDDAHVHARGNGVVEENGVDGLAHRVIATEGEAHVRHAARHLGAGQVLLDPARGLDEVDGVVVVLLDAGGNGEDIGVEDDVFRREPHLIDQDAVGPLADLDLALVGVGLALLVKGHDHGGGTIAAH